MLSGKAEGGKTSVKERKEDAQPADNLQASFIFLVFGNVAALECARAHFRKSS